MSKQPAAPQEGAGGERPNRARAINTAPSTQAAQPPARHRTASVQSERRQAVPGHCTTVPGPVPSPKVVRDVFMASPTNCREKPTGRRILKRKAGPRGRSKRRITVPLRGSAPNCRIYPPSQGPRYHRPPTDKNRQSMEFCLTACCILFWLLVIFVGVAVLVVYFIYKPQLPRLRVTSATLNAGYIDELGIGEMALNSDLTVLAAISNPNTKIHIVLHYMQLDLYFHGSLIGTQAVWPAPLHEGPGGYVLRSVHLVVSEVTLSREDVMLWHNATAKGGPVVLQLHGQFHTQLNFGRWLPFNYRVYPRCTLWLDPPPSGALRRARC